MYRRKELFKQWLWLILGWVIFTNLFSSIMMTNLAVFIQVMDIKAEVEQNELANYYISNYQYLESTLFGVLFGTIFFFTNWAMEYTSIHKKSFGTIVLLKSFLYLASFIIVFILIYSVFRLSGFIPHESFVAFFKPEFFSWKFFLQLLLFFSIFIIATNFIQLTARKFGPGNMFSIFMGKYHKPIVEERVFIFIDLKSSTTYAEKLGHLQYSQMIQQCFHDLNIIIHRHKAEIYQYVGDEAVITWKMKDALLNNNCLHLFYAFQNRLKRREAVYRQKFDLVPEFKAAVHGGKVTAAEIGDIKREIAYHGDVLNTTSRLQQFCNSVSRNFLITKELIDLLPDSKNFVFESLGHLQLKGKTNTIEAFTVTLKV